MLAREYRRLEIIQSTPSCCPGLRVDRGQQRRCVIAHDATLRAAFIIMIILSIDNSSESILAVFAFISMDVP